MSSRASSFGAPSQQMLQVPMDRQDQTAPDVRLDLSMETLICTAFAALNLARMSKVGGDRQEGRPIVALYWNWIVP